MLPQHFWVNIEPSGGNAPCMVLIPLVLRNSTTGTKSRSEDSRTANVVVVDPGQFDHVGCDACIDTFFLGASHVRSARLTLRHLFVTRWTRWPLALALPSGQGDLHAWKFIQRVRSPSTEVLIFLAGWVIRPVYVHTLVGDQSVCVDDPHRLPCDHRTQLLPIDFEPGGQGVHGQLEVPEIDKYHHASELLRSIVSRHPWSVSSSPQKYRDA